MEQLIGLPEIGLLKSLVHSQFALLQRIQDQIHQALSPIVGAAESFALIDVPVHDNVGDSAIFLGELAYLSHHQNTSPAYMCRADQCDYDRLATKYKDAMILIHGGGNFGDIWPWHHERREALLERFPGRQIVQLPQTIKFSSELSTKRTRDVINRHGNFTLMVRDQRSYEFAKTEFECAVILCPDTAFCMGPLRRVGASTRDLLLVLRKDRESSARIDPLSTLGVSNISIDDWHMDSRPLRGIRKLVALADTIIGTPKEARTMDQLRGSYLVHLAERRVARGLKMLSSGKFIITDRLHAYILALLLDIPHAVIDNNYGKISGFIAAWMKDEYPGSTFGTLADAMADWKTTRAAAISPTALLRIQD